MRSPAYFYKMAARAGRAPVWWLPQLPRLQGGKVKWSCWVWLEAAVTDVWGCAHPQMCYIGLDMCHFHPGLLGQY